MIQPGDLQCLKALAVMGGCRGSVRLSTLTLSSSLGTSPQTASRRLQSLERQMLVSRAVTAEGQDITITRKGEEELRREYAELRRIFEEEPVQYTLRGQVITGLGEGRYYMSLEPYRKQFQASLGFEPYPGTLNIRLDSQSVQVRKRLENLEWIRINGFAADHRTFGEARCLPCRIREVPCGIVLPVRSHYPEDILEIVAPTGLRERYGYRDADMVEVEVIA